MCDIKIGLVLNICIMEQFIAMLKLSVTKEGSRKVLGSGKKNKNILSGGRRLVWDLS